MIGDVSRETCDYLDEFTQTLLQWNERINLIGRGTASEITRRHIDDSAQLSLMSPSADHWLDLGSGGGFPGIVVAILRRNTSQRTTLIESDRRKSVFLGHISTKLGLNVEVLNTRIEDAEPQAADVVSARALASLIKLFELATRHGRPDTTYIFPKGANAETEIEEARRHWRFSLERFESKTADNSTILNIRSPVRV